MGEGRSTIRRGCRVAAGRVGRQVTATAGKQGGVGEGFCAWLHVAFLTWGCTHKGHNAGMWGGCRVHGEGAECMGRVQSAW
eukprot:50346-Chlamydomonas_euryale.AAC.1